jgi:hypothetical protein
LDGGAALTLVEAESGEIDQPGDVVQAGGGLGDDGAAVGLPDEHNRTVDRLHER